jgi:hypothetical protein
MNLLMTGIFILALSTSVLFLGKLMTWMVYKIAPQNCKKEFTNKDVLKANLIMIFSILLWAVLFYNSISC